MKRLATMKPTMPRAELAKHQHRQKAFGAMRASTAAGTVVSGSAALGRFPPPTSAHGIGSTTLPKLGDDDVSALSPLARALAAL